MISRFLLWGVIKAAPKIVQMVTEELAHRFKPVEKYVFEDNELDIKVVELEKRIMEFETFKKRLTNLKAFKKLGK